MDNVVGSSLIFSTNFLSFVWFYKHKLFIDRTNHTVHWFPVPFTISTTIVTSISRLAACQRIPATCVLPSNQNRAPCLSGVGSSSVALLLENSQGPDLAQNRASCINQENRKTQEC